MNKKHILRLDNESLNIIADMIASDKAYATNTDGVISLVMMDDLDEFKAWDDLSVYDVPVMLKHYQPQHEVVKLNLSTEQWHKLYRLLADDIVFMNHYNPEADNNFGLSVAILTNDIFHYAADAEAITLDDIDTVHQIWEEYGHSGVIRYVAEKRGYRPLDKYLDRIKGEGADIGWADNLNKPGYLPLTRHKGCN